MTNQSTEKYLPSEDEKQALYNGLKKDAEQAGYHINPDTDFVWMLMEGLLINDRRFGYLSCPCRLGSADIELDRDILCPCDYRDADVLNYDACYCSLYVSERILNGEIAVHSIPESRPALEERLKAKKETASGFGPNTDLPYPIWRCKVCGYLCARDNAPEICPICKAKHDRFEKFI